MDIRNTFGPSQLARGAGLQSVHLSRVRGNIQRGDKPHISFYHVRYTSQQLAQSAQLIGQSLRIFYDADDIRVLRWYTELVMRALSEQHRRRDVLRMLNRAMQAASR
jgi:hypothetical protein